MIVRNSPDPSRIDAPGEHRLSTVLRALAESCPPRISIAEITNRLGNRSFVPLMVLLAIPNLFFLVPVPSLVTGPLLILLSLQLLLGRTVPWLPRTIGNRSMEKSTFARSIEFMLPHVQRFERLARPRYLPATGFTFERLAGAASLVMAVFMFLPIPLANALPAVAIIILALALGEKDGLWLGVGLFVALLSVLLVAVIVSAGVAAIPLIFSSNGFSELLSSGH